MCSRIERYDLKRICLILKIVNDEVVMYDYAMLKEFSFQTDLLLFISGMALIFITPSHVTGGHVTGGHMTGCDTTHGGDGSGHMTARCYPTNGIDGNSPQLCSSLVGVA